MSNWKETSKKFFTWNQYVKISINGECVTDAVQVKYTHEYDNYEVDDMFGYNGCTTVSLVKPESLTIDAEQVEKMLELHRDAERRYERALANSSRRTDEFRAECLGIEKALDILGIEWC